MIEGRENFQVAAEPLTVSCPVRVEAGIGSGCGKGLIHIERPRAKTMGATFLICLYACYREDLQRVHETTGLPPRCFGQPLIVFLHYIKRLFLLSLIRDQSLSIVKILNAG